MNLVQVNRVDSEPLEAGRRTESAWRLCEMFPDSSQTKLHLMKI